MSNPFLKKKIPLATETPPLSEPSKPKVERAREPPKRSQDIDDLKRQLQVLQERVAGLIAGREQKLFTLENLIQKLQQETATSDLIDYLQKNLITDGLEPPGTGKHQAWLRARKILMSAGEYWNSR